MTEIVDDFESAFERYGRPKGPFETGRQHAYRATATAKPGPPVDRRHQEPPPPVVRPWWAENEEESPF
jgi:hypothetical protein